MITHKMTNKRKQYHYKLGLSYNEIVERLNNCNYTICFANNFKIEEATIPFIVKSMFNNNIHYTTIRNTYCIETNGEGITRQLLGTGRSLEDVYLCCKHYIPTVELHDVANYIFNEQTAIKCKGYCYTHFKYQFNHVFREYSDKEWLKNKRNFLKP